MWPSNTYHILQL